ncbi:MAG TPA: PAS domain S-box protein [Hyphomicrobiaceae bacterium]|nr:PAS domain S-box protein [Hyphomicrobiaceae bacterium]
MMLDRAVKDREQRAQRMLRRVVGASADVIYVYHVAWRRIAFLGARTREVLGFASARSNRLKAAEFERMLHPADLAGFRRHLVAIAEAREGEILSQELRVKGADGRYRWLRIRDTVLACGADGRVTKMVGVVSNIDESKRASAPTADDRPGDRLGDILATIGDSYIALDRRYRIVDVNAKAARWLRASREHIVGQSYLELIAPTADHAEAVRQAIEQRVARSIEMKSIRRPGAWLELHIHPTRDGASVFFRDISERKRAEREAERNRLLLQSALDALSAQIAILDETGTIIAANKAWEGQSVLPGARAGGRADSHARAHPDARMPAGVGCNYLSYCASALRSEETDSLRKGLSAVLGGERAAGRFAYCLESEGKRRWLQISAARFEWDGATRLIVTNEDLTDVKQAKEALSELSGRLSSLREEERQRIAQELHDSTAQHLVAATLNLMTLKAKSAAYPAVHQLLENVETSLEEATRELRVFTYLLHPLALENDGLERTLRTYLEGFGRRTHLGVELSVTGKVEELPFALQCSLLRIIQEALANVHRHASASQVSISLRMTPGALKLVVSDDGRGMSGPSGTGAGPSGVGIPGMRARLREFGGSLEIHSNPHGTTLSAAVPLGMATPWTRAPEPAPQIAAALNARSSHRAGG